jgi:hypothetical protein
MFVEQHRIIKICTTAARLDQAKALLLVYGE